MNTEIRTNAYRSGHAKSQKEKCSQDDNPYRKGTKEWHEWRIGFEKGIADFTKKMTDLIC